MRILLAIFSSCFFIINVCSDPQNGDLRLINGGSVPYQGRVEILLDQKWGTIVYDDIKSDKAGVAHTICRQQGYDSAANFGNISKLKFPPADPSTPVHLSNVICDYDSYTPNAIHHILRCKYNYPYRGAPDHSKDMAVVCSTIPGGYSLYNTQVRLNGSTTGYPSSGFVEIHLDGSFKFDWGPVCNMKTSDADSACRQLGYTNAAGFGSSPANYINGASQVDSFNCITSHACLRSCFKDSSVNHNVTCLQYSYINCTFDMSLASMYNGGSKDLCGFPWPSSRRLVALVVGVVIAAIILTILVSITIVCCCFTQGCILYKLRPRRVSYKVLY